MMVQIDVQPETAALLNEVRNRGISLDALLRETLKTMPPRPHASAKPDRLKTFFDAMAFGSELAPVLPPAADERGFYYEEGQE